VTEIFTHNSHDALPAQLAAAAGAGELAAAAAIDAEEGDTFLQALLADQMAAAHLVTMRMAAAADRALAAAADSDTQSTDNLPIFDLAAARFAGAAARLNGRYRRSLQTLRALAGPQQAASDEDIEWVGFTHPLFGEDTEMTEQERPRRINRAKSYHKLNQVTVAPPEAARRRSTAAEQALLASAAGAARSLVAATGVEALAATSSAQHVKLFAHQLAASHRLVMRLSGRADAVVMAAAGPLDRPEGLRLAHGAARLMERFQQGVAILQRLRTDPDRPGRVETYYSGPMGDYDREEERRDDIAAGIDPDTGLIVGPTASANTLTLLRRGRLNNGNPGGDFLAAPRCGARTRAGCSCRQPAMANGRCRFHGGKSTGPRTAAGLARSRAARHVHGLRSAEFIALAAAAAAAHRRLGALLAVSKKRIQHRVSRDCVSPRKREKILQSVTHSLVTPAKAGVQGKRRAVALDPRFRGGDSGVCESSASRFLSGHRTGLPSLAHAARNHPSSVLSVSSVVNLSTRSPAGHGVDRSESRIAPVRTATILPFTRPNPVQSSCRNRLPRVRS
jgi:hypothetical protein